MTSEKKFSPQQWFSILLFTVCILAGFDQWTKKMAVEFLKDKPAHVVIPNLLELRYLENDGAAFSIFQGQQTLFRILTVLFFAGALYFLFRLPRTKHYLPVFLSTSVLCAGAAGNFIDRISQNYVVDFIYISAIHFPVFNVADIYVSISVLVLLLQFLFLYKDNEFDFITRKRVDSK